MARLVMPVGLLLLLSLSGHAQDRPRIEIFGGFSHSDIQTGGDRIKGNGWHAAITVNSRQSWLEFVADFSGHYGSLGGAKTVTQVAMAGLRFSSQRGRLMWFTHSLYGVSFGRPPLIQLEEDINTRQRVWFTFVPGGGGLDVVLHRRIAIRVLQFDLVFHSQTPDYLQNSPQLDQTSTIQPRLSVGIVLRIGKI